MSFGFSRLFDLFSRTSPTFAQTTILSEKCITTFVRSLLLLVDGIETLANMAERLVKNIDISYGLNGDGTTKEKLGRRVLPD